MSEKINYQTTATGQVDLSFEEKHVDGFSNRFQVKQTLFSEKTAFQQIDIIETTGFGRMLLNDGLVMISERDEFVYHEMMVHVPFSVHPDPKDLLIIGGGDGGNVREALRYPQLETCTLVEIDEAVVRGCKEFIPLTAGCLDHKKVKVLFEDGVKFVKEQKKKYDVILVDSTDPFGPGEALFGPDFYKDCFERLNENGVLVVQAESPFLDPKTQLFIKNTLAKFFPLVAFYNFSNLTYPGGLWSFAFASKGLNPIRDHKIDKTKLFQSDLKYYSPAVHKAAFSLPKFMQALQLKDKK